MYKNLGWGPSHSKDSAILTNFNFVLLIFKHPQALDMNHIFKNTSSQFCCHFFPVTEMKSVLSDNLGTKMKP